MPIIETLRQIPLFAKLSEQQLLWLREQGDELNLETGHLLFEETDHAHSFYVLLVGELQITKKAGLQEIILNNYLPGSFIGESALFHAPYDTTVRAVCPSRLWGITSDVLPKLLSNCLSAAGTMLPTMVGRIQTVESLVRHQEKITALGKFSAGLAHEFNNPASAAERAAIQLRERLEVMTTFSMKLGLLSESERTFLFEIRSAAAKRSVVDPVNRSDLEEACANWLDSHGVSEGWRLAPTLVASGFDNLSLERLAITIDNAMLREALTWLEASLASDGLIHEIEQSTGSIYELVHRMKGYSYMDRDRTSKQLLDVHAGLENTLALLAHRLKNASVERHYAGNLPFIRAYGGELNQVWTILIENALDATKNCGCLRVNTKRENDYLLVEISDDGPGIPMEIQSRIFEPFFTTKGAGEGIGLGLDDAYQIVVRRHRGDIRVRSIPADTCFQVRLPIILP
jgi:signal transduction histidine kinase